MIAKNGDGISRKDCLRTALGLNRGAIDVSFRLLPRVHHVAGVQTRCIKSERSEQSGFANPLRGTFGMYEDIQIIRVADFIVLLGP